MTVVLGVGSASRHSEKGRRVPARILRGLGTMLEKMILQEVLSERKTLSPSQGSLSQSVGTRAVEPDFKKSNKKSDAQGACRRLYPTFA